MDLWRVLFASARRPVYAVERSMAKLTALWLAAPNRFSTMFRKSGVEERINLQRDGNSAKPYQVKQVRAVILKYKLGEIE